MTEEEFGLDALVEVHNEEEMKRAVDAGGTLIGVNNRDLRTFEVSLETSVRLRSAAPVGTTLVSESGLTNFSDLRRLQTLGYHGFLIGESLMRAENVELALRSLIGKSRL
jgi:indole-3-glycerol phosphate synthase